ncbi:5-hydroxyisourate hydrolase [Chironomus tepperi]|uniref:5-hydroxyisourate hydrolase n=1 Tax=Chironomus tepperi TaxID=113505 RepID=UPI00391F481B
MDQKLSLSTHILDVSLGKPAEGVTIKLFKSVHNTWIESANSATTDSNGRFKDFKNVDNTVTGIYKIRFETKDYFDRLGINDTLYPYIEIIFEIKSSDHYHIPLLLSAFGYSTYRGS